MAKVIKGLTAGSFLLTVVFGTLCKLLLLCLGGHLAPDEQAKTQLEFSF